MRTRLDWLEDQLEREDLPTDLRGKYEQEVDRLIDNLNKAQERAQYEVNARRQRSAYLKEQLMAGNLDVIDTFGMPEFGDDYETKIEGTDFVVYSKVARDDQENRWVFDSAEAANSKYRKLVWDRMYSKYVRTGEVDHLSQLID